MSDLIHDFNASQDRQIDLLDLSRPKQLFLSLRNFLLKEAESDRHRTKPHHVGGILHLREGRESEVVLGPSIDKGETPEHFQFGSGGRLCFGWVLREEAKHAVLKAAWLVYVRAERKFVYEVKAQTSDALIEPRAHYDWARDVRLPTPVLHPLHLLQVVFRVLDQ